MSLNGLNKMIHISPGNTKIGKTGNISLPPILACPDAPCHHHCYAIKLYRRSGVKKAWDDNFDKVLNNPTNYFSTIRRYLLKNIPQYFRWHVSGDILDQQYLDQMISIANDYYFIRFVTFTKMYHLDFGNTPSNLAVVVSVWPGIPIPNLGLPLAFIDMKEETRTVNAFKCMDDCESCRACWNLGDRNVLLREH